MAPAGALPHVRDSAPWKQAKFSDDGVPGVVSWMSCRTFVQIAQLSWQYLDKKTRRSIRLSSSSGRLVADGQRDSLEVSDKAWSRQANELKNAIAGMLARGVLLQELELTSLGSYSRRALTFASMHERMLSFLAALAAPAAAGASCTPQPISRLALRCYLSLSEAIADALLTAFPRVSDLTIITFDQEDVHSAAYGIMQLVSRYGAQLQRLELRPLSLPPLALYSLSACTGLLRLELTHEEFPTGGTLGGELSALRAVSRLRSLKHLQLKLSNANTYKECPVTDAHTVAEYRRHATALQQLSSLTALTHLELSLSHHRRCDTEYSTLAQLQRQGPEVLSGLRTVWNAQQASLMAALRCMPQLQHLDCQDFHLPANEISTLTALTHLEIAGLLGPATSPAAAAAPLPAASVTLPPQLQTMQLPYGCVRTLAAIQPPESLKAVTAAYNSSHSLSFSVWDLTPDGKRLLPAAVRAVRGAVRLLAREREGSSEGSGAGPFNGRTLFVGPFRCDVAPIEPPEGQEGQEGHAAWICMLRRLNRHNVTFSGFALGPTDLLCIARKLDMIRVLDLRGSSFLLSALPSLAVLPHLRELRFAVKRCTGVSAAQLESALLLTAVFAGALRKLAAHDWEVPTMAAMITQKVHEGLRQHGAEGVRVVVLGPDEDSDDESDEGEEEEEEEEGEGEEGEEGQTSEEDEEEGQGEEEE